MYHDSDALILLQATRRDYRELFYTAPGMGEHIAGAILFKETLGQSSSEGVPFVECLKRQGILPGIKVDEVISHVQLHVSL